MTNFCTIHQAELTERTSKDKFDDEGNPKTYWAHIKPEGGLCFGEGVGKSMRKASVEPAQPSLVDEAISTFNKSLGSPKEDVMTKADWREKDDRIARLTLAKTFIQAGIDYDNAVLNGDLDKWEIYVLGKK